jgi:hypothetical protein
LQQTNKPNVSAAKTIKKSFSSELAGRAAAARRFQKDEQIIIAGRGGMA